MKSFWFALMVVFAALRAESAVTVGVITLSITNQTEFLIAADALTNAAGTDRDAVQVRAVVSWTNDLAFTANDTTRYEIRLLSGPAAANIFTESGAVGTIYRFTNIVSVPGTGSGGRISRTNSFSLRPSGQLNPYTNYSVQVILFDGATKMDTSETAERQFWHFTNLVSGDAAFNVLGALETNGWQQTFAIDTVPGEDAFQIANRFRLYRFDDFNGIREIANIPIRMTWQLQDTNGNVIPTTPSVTNFTFAIYNYDDGTPQIPRELAGSRVISFRPGAQLDSVSNRYRVVVTMSLSNNPSLPAQLANSVTTPSSRLLHYNGTLLFGDVSATLTNLIGVPDLGFNFPGASYVNADLDGTAVFQTSTPNISFDLNGPRNFHLLANGDAELPSGTITVPSPASVQYFTNGNVRIRRTGITLSSGGAIADFRFFLPAGFGLSTNYADTHVLDSQILFNDIGLDSSLEPRTNIVRVDNFVASTESKPVFIQAEKLEWSIASHSFRLTPHATFPILGVRFVDQGLLNGYSNSMVFPSQALKRANDGYYQYVNDVGLVTVTATPGNVADVDFIATFNNGSFAPHFPMGPIITWTNGGSIRINNNGVLAGASSRLEGVQAIVQQYISSCAGCDGTMTTNPITITPTNRYLNFTRDGGLVGVRDTTLNVTPNFSWGFSTSAGTYAHRATAVRELTFLMSGHFLQGSDNPSSAQNGPGILHLTGVAGTNLNVIERPFSNGYDTVGRADYAGMNGRSVAPSPTPTAVDTLTGTIVSFTRTSRSKYYVRLGGVSGIHEAVPGSFDSTLTMLGYPFTFDNYGFSFLDSQNIESRTDGSVSVPAPSLFTLPFKELRLTCAGGLESAELPASTGYRRLDYWNADFLPQSLRFEGQPGEECDPTQAYLVLGVRAHASYVNEPLSGTMGFFANGSIIPPHFGLPGVQSRFELPSQFRFSGPVGSGDWVLTPVAPAYFTTNDYAFATNGYLNVVGELNVPFFEGIKVQLHTGARTNNPQVTPPIRLAGGWPRAGDNNVNGWKIGSDNYFNDADFDDVNRGFPAGVNIETYVNSGSPLYRAVAERTWLDVVDLKYPLYWDPALRYFRSSQGSLTDLFVVQAPHQLTYLDPQRAIIDIGVRYDGLPIVTLTHFLADATGNSAASAMRDAIQADAYAEITNGLATADGLLSENPTRLVDALLASHVDLIVTNLMGDLNLRWDIAKANGSNARANFAAESYGRLLAHFFGGGGVTESVRKRLLDLGVKAVNGPLFPTLSKQITQVTAGIGRNANSFDGGAVGATAIRNLVNLSASQFNPNVAGPELEAALSQNAPAFNQLRALMLNAQNGIASHTNGLSDGSSGWASELDAAWNAAALPLRKVSTNAFIRIAQELLSYNWRIDDPLVGGGSAQMQARMKEAIRDNLVGEPVIATVRTSIKQRLFDLNENYRTAANSLFAQYNFVARDLISRSLASVDNNFSPGLGSLSDYFGISRLQGHAEIQDDSLRELRLDARVKLKVPDDMAFNAYLEIKEQNSENTPEACLPPNNEPATEVRFGATDVELDWISDGLRATVGTKINLVSGHPTGFAGSLETTGPLEFAGFVIKKIGFAMAFGQEENYLAANARVKLGQSSEIAGGLFFGRACDLDPLIIAVASVSPYLLADVNPKNIFGEPPFTGGFVYGEGMFPVFSIGCIFEVRLIAGAGGWFFVEGPKFGGIIKAGVSGTAICVLTVSGDITLIGAKREGGMTFAGLAHVEGCFGIWPLEICVDADTSVQYTEGKDWDADEP